MESPIEFRPVTSTSVGRLSRTTFGSHEFPQNLEVHEKVVEQRLEPWKWNAQIPHSRQKQIRAPNLCSARRREDDIKSGRVSDVVRTTTSAPVESRINSGCPLIRRASHPLCLTAHPQQSISILGGLALDQSSVKGSRHIRRLGRQGARRGPGTSRLLAQVCASSARHRIRSHPSDGRGRRAGLPAGSGQWPTSDEGRPAKWPRERWGVNPTMP